MKKLEVFRLNGSHCWAVERLLKEEVEGAEGILKDLMPDGFRITCMVPADEIRFIAIRLMEIEQIFCPTHGHLHPTRI